MKRAVICGVFFAILASHFFYVTRNVSIPDSKGAWAAYDFEKPEASRLKRYIVPGEYWLGLSYGIAGAFAAFALMRAVKMHYEALAASAGGLALGGLWTGGCFLAGCCGSPMLPVYMGLFGPKFLGLAKPVTFALTLISILIGCRLMIKREKRVLKGRTKCQQLFI